MSRYCAGSVIPGCGRQSREVGAHGKIESKAAVGSCVFSVKWNSAAGSTLTLNTQLPTAAVGAHGKIESKAAVGSCVFSVSVELAAEFHFTLRSQMLSASDAAP